MQKRIKSLIHLLILLLILTNWNTPAPMVLAGSIHENGVASNDGELKAAIGNAKPGDTIYVTDMKIREGLSFESPAFDEIDVILASSDGKPVTIDVSAVEHPAYAFDFNGLSAVSLTFQNVTVDGGSTGSAIRFNKDGGTLSLNGAVLQNCKAKTDGGAICVEYGNVLLNDCVFQGNSSSGNGGGIYIEDGVLDAYGCTFANNEAQSDGGGVWISDLSKLFSRNVVFRDNRAATEYKWTLDAGDVANIHRSNIIDTTFTVPFTNAFNNYDVNFSRDVTPAPGSDESPRPTLPSEPEEAPLPTVSTESGARPRPTGPPQTGSTQPPLPPTDGGASLLPNEDGSYDVVNEEGDEVGRWEKNDEGEWIYHTRSTCIPWYYPFILGLLFGFICFLTFSLFRKRYVTRGEFVEMMAGFLPLEEANEDAVGYEDVPKDDERYRSILMAKSSDLLNGFTGHKFHPDVTITREEMAGVLASVVRLRNPLAKTEDVDLKDKFKDFDKISTRFLDDVKLVCALNLMSDIDDDVFDPQGFSTRRKARALWNELSDRLDVTDTN